MIFHSEGLSFSLRFLESFYLVSLSPLLLLLQYIYFYFAVFSLFQYFHFCLTIFYFYFALYFTFPSLVFCSGFSGFWTAVNYTIYCPLAVSIFFITSISPPPPNCKNKSVRPLRISTILFNIFNLFAVISFAETQFQPGSTLTLPGWNVLRHTDWY